MRKACQSVKTDASARILLAPLTATNGIEAVALYTEKGKQIDLVATDLNMPFMGGLDVLAELRKLNPNLKAIVFTGMGIVQEPVAAKNLAQYICLKKPFDAALLLNTLHSVLVKNS